MSRQLQITTAPLWKLAGFVLLLLSFTFTSWMLANATNAAAHLSDTLVDLLQTHTAFLPSHEHNLLAH